MAIASRNPATGETLREFTPLTSAEIEVKLANANAAFQQPGRRTFEERGKLMKAAADLLDANRDSLARTITSEMGKLLPASRDEVSKCASVCRFYAENAAQFLAPHEVRSDGQRSYIRYDPLGAILAVMP